MIRPLLLLAMGVGVGSLANATLPAESLSSKVLNPAYERTAGTAKAVSRAEDGTLIYSYCGSPYTAYQLNGLTGKVLSQAVAMPDFVAAAYAGDSITAIQVGNPTNTSYRNPVRNVTVFIAESLDSEPVYTQSATLGTEGFGITTVTLDTPYVITGSNPVIFGYEFKAPSGSYYPIVVDDDPTYFSFAGLYKVGNDEWTSVGANIMLLAELNGDARPEILGMPVALEGPRHSTVNKETSAKLTVFNFATADIEDMEVSYVLGNASGENIVSGDACGMCKGSTYNVALVPEEAAIGVSLTCNITKINGEPNSYIPDNENSVETTFNVSTGEGYQRRLVIEEGTGTWCGWCPLGYLALESARERYADTGLFIPIAVHNGDAMAPASYSGWESAYISGLPSFMANRMNKEALGFAQDTTYNNSIIDALYDEITGGEAFADVNLTVEKMSETSIMVTATTCFAESSENNPYALAFVVKEDGVGPYRQANYLSGTAGFGQFSTGGSYVQCMYNDVARLIETWNGIDGSLPASVVGGEEYTYTRSISISTVKNKKVFDVVALIINKVNGEIENANICHFDADQSVIESVTGEPSKVAVYAADGAIFVNGACDGVAVYTVEGRLVKTAAGEGAIAVAPGLYIVKAGETVAKVNVK